MEERRIPKKQAQKFSVSKDSKKPLIVSGRKAAVNKKRIMKESDEILPVQKAKKPIAKKKLNKADLLAPLSDDIISHKASSLMFPDKLLRGKEVLDELIEEYSLYDIKKLGVTPDSPQNSIIESEEERKSEDIGKIPNSENNTSPYKKMPLSVVERPENEKSTSKNAMDNREIRGVALEQDEMREQRIDLAEDKPDNNEEVEFKYEENECSICLIELRVAPNIVALPCYHVFHEDCIKDWLKKRSVCPNCNNPTTPF